MKSKFYIDAEGNYLGAFCGAEPPDGSIEVPEPQPQFDSVWDGSKWQTPQHHAWAAVRAKRDQLLSACDWTQVADAPVDKEAWAVYRQALRDVPATQSDPLDIDWPLAPV